MGEAQLPRYFLGRERKILAVKTEVEMNLFFMFYSGLGVRGGLGLPSALLLSKAWSSWKGRRQAGLPHGWLGVLSEITVHTEMLPNPQHTVQILAFK